MGRSKPFSEIMWEYVPYFLPLSIFPMMLGVLVSTLVTTPLNDSIPIWNISIGLFGFGFLLFAMGVIAAISLLVGRNETTNHVSNIIANNDDRESSKEPS